MVELITNKFMRQVVDTGEYSKEEIEEIEFGFAATLFGISKIFVVIIIAFLLQIGFEMLIYMAIALPIKKFSYGFHSNDNLTCWILTLFLNLSCCYLGIISTLDKFTIIIILLFSIFLFYLFAPADIENLPLISKDMRKKQRNKSILTIISYIFIVLLSNNIFINNIILIITIYQALIISPFFYIIFNTTYRNYLKYEEK